MPELAFLPWFSIRTGLKAGGYELIPYNRGGSPGVSDAEQESVSRLLDAYLAESGQTTDRAVLVREEGRDLFHERTETERADIFRFSEILSFVGLASRAYFRNDLAYVNRDNFRLFLQAFTGEPGDVTVVSRRRDGITRNHFPSGSFRAPWPSHVPSSADLDLDGHFLEALLAPQPRAVDEGLLAAIMTFNEANSESSWSTPQAELVWLAGAFERLFGIGKGDENVLAKKVVQAWSAFSRLSGEHSERLAQEKHRCRPLIEHWIRDLYRLRGTFAHGHRVSPYHSKWTTQEHLLLGSHSFPLTVKIELHCSEKYRLSNQDETGILGFDGLLGHPNLLIQEACDNGRRVWPWAQLMDGAAWEIAERKAISDLTEEPRGSSHHGTAL